MKIYEGNENYIFLSYSHKDSQTVIPIIERLDASGFRVWYDSGIEAGSEWPEYIEEHLKNASVVVVFISPSSVESRNCRNEINFALDLGKDILVVYLEETELAKGMRLQLTSTHSLYKQNHDSYESFISSLVNAHILKSCHRNADKATEENKTINAYTTNIPKQDKNETLISLVSSIGSNSESEFWPKGTYSDTINKDEFRLIFFHTRILEPIGFKGTVNLVWKIYNENNNLIYRETTPIEVEEDYETFSNGWILKGTDGTSVPSGKYKLVISINNSPEFEYTFFVTSNRKIGGNFDFQSIGETVNGVFDNNFPHKKKNKVVAVVLAFLFGSIGMHKFYLRRYVWGIVYLVFCSTGIPTIVSVVEALIMLGMSEETFQAKCVKHS